MLNDDDDEDNDFILPESNVKPLPEQVDDSKIQQSNILKIYSSNDPKFLDTVMKKLGDITPEEELLIKKLTITALGKKRGFFNDKVVGMITDESFLTNIMNGSIDIERLKMMLKFEMDDRVDNSFETKMERGYIKFTDFEKMFDNNIERFNIENKQLKSQIKTYSDMMVHYIGRLPINNKFLSLRCSSPNDYIVQCLNITGQNIANIDFSKKYTMIDYIFDYQFIVIMIDQMISEEEDRYKFFTLIKEFLLGLDVDTIATTFTPETDPLYRSLPQQVKGIITYIDSLMVSQQIL